MVHAYFACCLGLLTLTLANCSIAHCLDIPTYLLVLRRLTSSSQHNTRNTGSKSARDPIRYRPHRRESVAGVEPASSAHLTSSSTPAWRFEPVRSVARPRHRYYYRRRSSHRNGENQDRARLGDQDQLHTQRVRWHPTAPEEAPAAATGTQVQRSNRRPEDVHLRRLGRLPGHMVPKPTRARGLLPPSWM